MNETPSVDVARDVEQAFGEMDDVRIRNSLFVGGIKPTF